MLDFDVTAPSSLATPDSSGATSAIEEEDAMEDSAATSGLPYAAVNGADEQFGQADAGAAALAGGVIGAELDDIGVGILENPVLQFGDDGIVWEDEDDDEDEDIDEGEYEDTDEDVYKNIQAQKCSFS